MARAFARSFAAGFGPVLLRGSDVPDLPAAVVSEATAVLTAGQAQVVLGPATDGGYHLVGLTEPQPALFQGPAWSSSTVLADTLGLAQQLGLGVHLLPPWPDIDTYDNLRTFLNRPRPAPAARLAQPGGGPKTAGLDFVPGTWAAPLTPKVPAPATPPWAFWALPSMKALAQFFSPCKQKWGRTCRTGALACPGQPGGACPT